jgi:hypothetical protein
MDCRNDATCYRNMPFFSRSTQAGQRIQEVPGSPASGYSRHLASSGEQGYSRGMAMLKSRFLCQMCEHVEEHCKCEKYCNFCQMQETLRLCSDGLYYCAACRESCDYQVENIH